VSTGASGRPRYADRMAPSRFGTHRMIAERVAPGERVLDVGAGEGALALALKEKGCRVVCLEVDPGQAEAARAKGLEVKVHNIEREGLNGLGPFDIVVCADVLEHLLDPDAALKKLKGALAPGGRLLTSIPNVAFYGVRLRLLAGRWDYTDTGILDRTHLRFYTRKTSRRLLEEAGLRVRYESITIAPPTSAVPAVVSGWQKLLENRTWGTAVHRALSVAPGFFGSQFVFEAVPE
jgi:2-polyprenyl-3-methyl-5-hydroxy-6-metoxy-1,4-benzoquinol methylase